MCDIIFDMQAAVATPRDAIRAIIAEEARKAGVAVDALLGRCRRRAVVRARHAAMRRVHDAFPRKSYPEIGRIFGRDHSTVMYALCAHKRSRRP